MKALLDQTMEAWLEDNDCHDDRPDGLACPNLADMMASAAAAVYDASHSGAVAGAEDAKANM